MVETELIELDKFPQLRLLAWGRGERAQTIPGDEALAMYESNWRHIDQESLLPEESKLIRDLVERYGHGVLNV